LIERIVLPDVSDDINGTLGYLLDRLNAKTHRNLLRDAYYDGKRALSQVGTVIPPHYYRLGIVLGWSAKGVDSLARRCNLDGLVWPDGKLDSLGLGDLWQANNLDSEVDQALIASLIHSVAFAITTRGDTAAGEPAALLHFKDAKSATGEWDYRARRLKNLLSITGRDAEGKPSALALYLDGLTVVAEKSDGTWDVDLQEHSWGVPAEPLVYKPRLGREFGTSRISRAVMSIQDMATRAVIRLEGHMDVYSWPEFWMLGADESIFKNADGTPKASWQVMLGRIKGIPDDDEAVNPRAEVKQFPAASPEPHLAALNVYAKLLARELSLPDSALALQDMANPTSAESYTASREDLIAEAEGATDDWASPLRRAMVRTLAMQNGLDAVPPEWQTIATKWRSPIYLSRAQQADAGAKQIGAVPWLAETEVGLELLGLDRQQVERAVSERRRAEARQTLEMLRRATGDDGS
jgi:hypothetical protein